MDRYNYSDYDPDRYGRNERMPSSPEPARRRPAADDNRYRNDQRRGDSRRYEPIERERDRRQADRQPRRDHNSGGRSLIARFFDFITSMRTRVVTGIALLLLCCWLTVAALSFLKSNGSDQSKVTSLTTEQLAADPSLIDNTAGPAGAKVSQHLFVEGLGMGSIVLIIYMVIIALALLGVRKIKFWKLTFKMLMLAITISMVLGLVFINSGASIPPGGYHGRYINILMISNIGWIGAVLVNGLLVAVTVTLYINELMGVYNRYQAKMRTLRDRRQRAEDQRRYREEEIQNALADTPLSQANVPEGEDEATTDIDTDEQVDDRPVIPELEDPENYHITIGDPHLRREGDNVVDSVEDQTDYQQATSQQDSDNNYPADEETNQYGNQPEQQSAPEQTVPATSQVAAAATPAIGTSENGSNDSALSSETNNKTSEAENDGPGFEIRHEKEIEQGDGLPEQLAAQGPYDPRADLSHYRMPSIDLLKDRPRKTISADINEQEENKERITRTLEQYNVKIDKIKATVGPTVTLYEIIPAEGVRIATIKRLEDDIAMSLAALGIRIIAPIPGKGTIGIEVPNKEPQTVSIRSILGSKAFQETKMELPMALGATISNDVFIADLAKMPHLLVAGATGQGKSVGLNTIIASLLYKRHPAELKFVLVDPKMVEFSLYACLEKYYLAKLPNEEEPVVTDPYRVVDTLKSLCQEMDDRYNLLKDAGCRSIIEYNERFINRRLNPENGHRFMPYIVVIVDEFADLIMMAGKEVETPIARIAQKARAVGIHMIIATQRPSTNVITGIIKANFPGRIGFRVSQMVDSRTILDSPGANQLIGKGDMLISSNGTMERVQCAFIDTDEVENLCAHIHNQQSYDHAYLLPEPPEDNDDKGGGGAPSIAELDPLLEDVGRWIVQGNTASTSSVQRRYSIGYNRAGKIMDQLERFGVVDKAQGGKPRRVLVDPMMLEDILMQIRR